MNASPNLADLRATLGNSAARTGNLPIHMRAFVAWLLRDTVAASPIAAEARGATGAARTPQMVAALGFIGDLLGPGPSDTALLLEDLGRLASRQYFAIGRPRSLERDATALLGITLATRWTAATDSTWLKGLLAESLRAAERELWERSLLLAAAAISGVQVAALGTDAIAPEVSVALTERGVFHGYGDVATAAWSAVVTLDGVAEDPSRAAVLLVAFDRIMRDALPARLSHVEVTDVCRVLHGIARSMRRWAWDAEGRTPRSSPARWDVENEYHVQSLVWAVLAPLLPDLEDEEWLASVGHKHPRADLAVPSLGLLIEVKFLRDGDRPAKVIEEVSADTGLYLREGGQWKGIVAFVWDDSRRTEEHAELRQGLLGLRGVVDAVVVPRPRAMERRVLMAKPRPRRGKRTTFEG